MDAKRWPLSRAGQPPRTPWALASGLVLALGLTGCASLSGDGGMAQVRAWTPPALADGLQVARTPQDLDRIQARVAELLAAPLTAESAVQVALLNNRGLQASIHALGVTEAEVVQASRLPNPGLHLGRVTAGHEREIERGFSWNLARLLALPHTRQMEQQRLRAQQQQLAMEVVALAAQARKAFYTAVAAEQLARYMHDVRESADAGAELARRMAQAGNWNKLEQAREHAFFSEAVLKQAQAEAARVASREQLTRLLGLWGAQTAFQLPARLPDLPSTVPERPDIEREALATRLDVLAARSLLESAAQGLGLSRATRFVNVLELGLKHSSSNEGKTHQGMEIGFEIPIFDWGDARIARAEASYMQTVHRAAQTAIEARSEVRERYHRYRTAHDIARHYRDDVVPTAKRISDENLLRYNGMFISVFELLADARSQMAAVMGAIEAQRDFWLAEADLHMALLGKPTPGGLVSLATKPPSPALAADPH